MTDESVFEESLGVDVNKQIVKSANEWLHPLVPYGPSKALHEMTRRIMQLDTGKHKMKASEAAHLAQISAATQLNPFNGEIWAWVYVTKHGERKFQIMPGRRGLLRHAHQQAQERGTHFWPEYTQVTDKDRRDTLGVPEGAMAWECAIYDHKTVQTWKMAVDSVVEARKQGLEIGLGRLGAEPPFVFGLGILTKEEMANLDRDSSNKMTHVERTQKRAYMMAIKQMFDLPLGGSFKGETIEEYIPEAQWREVEKEAEIEDEETAEARKKVVSDAASELWPDANPWDNEQPREIKPTSSRTWGNEIVTKIRENFKELADAPPQQIEGRLNKSPFREDDPWKWISDWLEIYNTVRPEHKTSESAAKEATTSWARENHDNQSVNKRFGERTIKAWQKSDG
jgi:hypothetical protein